MRVKIPEYYNTENNVLKIEVYYSLGGYDYFSYKEEKRGFYISLRPMKESKEGLCSFSLFGKDSGYKILLEEVKRNNPKRLKVLKEAFENEETCLCLLSAYFNGPTQVADIVKAKMEVLNDKF